ncbi:MAG: hypothetical protein EHM87_16580 [Burkholderiales bacterium]|nr:MAG: hypothetical protein EHM87_16580 [Burkholderiales bacterium]
MHPAFAMLARLAHRGRLASIAPLVAASVACGDAMPPAPSAGPVELEAPVATFKPAPADDAWSSGLPSLKTTLPPADPAPAATIPSATGADRAADTF